MAKIVRGFEFPDDATPQEIATALAENDTAAMPKMTPGGTLGSVFGDWPATNPAEHRAAANRFGLDVAEPVLTAMAMEAAGPLVGPAMRLGGHVIGGALESTPVLGGVLRGAARGWRELRAGRAAAPVAETATEMAPVAESVPATMAPTKAEWQARQVARRAAQGRTSLMTEDAAAQQARLAKMPEPESRVMVREHTRALPEPPKPAPKNRPISPNPPKTKSGPELIRSAEARKAAAARVRPTPKPPPPIKVLPGKGPASVIARLKPEERIKAWRLIREGHSIEDAVNLSRTGGGRR